MSTQPCIMIVGAGPNQLPAIKLAKQKGYRVVATDMNPNAEGFAWADDQGIASTRDVEATVDFALASHQKSPIHGVMTMASESAVAVASVAQALGLPGISPDAAKNATHKVRRQLLFRQHQIPAPRFEFANTVDEACRKTEVLGWPVVVKPVDSAGSRGVQKVHSPQEMVRAVEEIRTYSQVPEFLIEEFLVGTEHSIEGLVVNGKVHWLGLSDRNYDKKEMYPPYFLEDGDTMPSLLQGAVVSEIERVAAQAVHALEIDWGPVKGDIFVDATKGVQVIEMAARLSGDYFCYETIPLHNGINLLDILMDLSLGLNVDEQRLLPSSERGVALRYVWPVPGKVTSIEGLDQARALDGVHFVNFEPHWRDISVGSIIEPAKSMGERVACVMAHAESREKAVEIAEAAVALIKIQTT